MTTAYDSLNLDKWSFEKQRRLLLLLLLQPAGRKKEKGACMHACIHIVLLYFIKPVRTDATARPKNINKNKDQMAPSFGDVGLKREKGQGGKTVQKFLLG